MRTRQQIAEGRFSADDEFLTMLRNVSDANSAKDALPKVHDYFDRVKKLGVEDVAAEKRATQQQNEQFESQVKDRKAEHVQALSAGMAEFAKKTNIPKDVASQILTAVKEGQQDVKRTIAEAEAQPAVPPPEILPDNRPDSSTWAAGILCLLVLGVCVGFLFRDGVWSNAIRLVNVVFAGLLAMNFYEWLATFLTNYSESLHPYVSLFDFLALWICFVFFMVVFRALTDAVSRVRVRFLKIVDQAGGIVLSLCIGWVMVGFTLASLHTAPLAQYPLFGSFQPQSSMFFGMLAPDREWLGFTKYQSSGPYCRSVSEEDLKKCTFPPDFIEKHLERRMHVEKYIFGNNDHAILVNKQFFKQTPQPGGK